MGNAKETQFEIYRLMVETWRWQIDSNWHRTAYFAAFQTAVLVAAGYAISDVHCCAGKLILDMHFYVGFGASVFGFLLNISWIFNDRKTGAYTDYWRKAAESMEIRLPWQFVSKLVYEKQAKQWKVRRGFPKYTHLMLFVRLLFAAVWILLLVFYFPPAYQRFITWSQRWQYLQTLRQWI
jgi:recombinational DNA repair protein (RecF pathway)